MAVSGSSAGIVAVFVVVTVAAGCGGPGSTVDEVDQARATSSSTAPPSSSATPTVKPTGAVSPTGPAAPRIPSGWVTYRFGHLTVSTPPTWASVTLKAGKLNTRAKLNSQIRKTMSDDLKQPDVLGDLVDTKSLGASFREHFITAILMSTEEADDSITTSEEMARIAREDLYVGPDEPKDVAISTLPASPVPAVKARYTHVENGDKAVYVDYALSFPGAIVHLNLSTDIRKPAPDIATSDAIARTVRYT